MNFCKKIISLKKFSEIPPKNDAIYKVYSKP